ncbi:hypothetical protein OpiT1DRAFT_05489 [Opitutaceae bacterium TAV1]|nr:hypothetical protein OpiT1DRAFT_05489 [Opitutaceae bacterium TAV1]
MISRRFPLVALATFFALLCSGVRAETYTIDTAHSSVAFSIRHFVSKVPGKFTTFSGTVSYDPASPEASSAQAVIEVGSVDTSNAKRDDHLKRDDFFDAAKFTTITFQSKSWKKTGENTFDVTGDLTIKDVTREVVLKTTLLGVGPGPGGATLSGWEATTTIDKSAFGVNGPSGLGAALGDDVAVTINIEAKAAK